MNLKIEKNVAWQLVGDEALIVDLRDGYSLGLNPVGSFIWSRLERLSREEIGNELVGAFNVTHDVALRDIDEFVAELKRRGFVTDQS